MTSEFDFKNILIVGLGVMGGSFLKKLQNFDVNIYAIEVDLETQTKAKNKNKNIEFINLDNLKILKKIDLVILTLYPNKVVEYFEKLNNLINPECLVIEISGIKNEIAYKLESLNLNYNYLLTHPMAGRENGGYDYSDEKIFFNANYIIVDDVKSCSDQLMDKHLDFIKAIGFKKPIYLSSQVHDKQITYSSQLPHIISIALMNSVDYQGLTCKTIGDSFKDLTRIAKLKVDLWNILFSENKDNLNEIIENFINQLKLIQNDLNDSNLLNTHLEKARERRIELEK